MGRHLPDDDSPNEMDEGGPRASSASSSFGGSSGGGGNSKRQRTAAARHDQRTTVISIPMLAHPRPPQEDGGGGGVEAGARVAGEGEARAEDDEEGAGVAPGAPRAQIDAVCFKCFDTGARRLYSIRLAYHAREAVVENFECPGCGYYSNEILAMDAIAEPPPRDRGAEATVMEDETDGSGAGASRPEPQRDVVSSTLTVDSAHDLGRRIIKSRDGALVFSEIEFEIPAVSQRGEVDTLAGFMRRAVRELSPNLRDESVAVHVRTAIETTVSQLKGYLEGNQPFTVRLDDPKGDSFIEIFDEADRSVSRIYG